MASSVIGALRVNLGLDSANFNKGLSDAQRRIKSAGTQFKAIAGAAVAVGGALTALAVKVSSTAAEIERSAQVANAAPAEFQKWAAASSTVGIEQEKLADILKDVNDRVGDFVTTGGGPMKDFFEQIAPKVGITADAFRNLSGPQALQLYVSSLEKAGLSQQEMTFYLEAMASDATALIPLLRNGGAEMSRLGDNAASLGGIMSDKTVKSLAGFKLALQDAGTAIQGVGYRISGELAPSLTMLATAFADSMREGGLLRTVIDGLINNIERLTTYLAVAVAGFGVRYVAAIVAARLATATLTGALVALRAALIRTGIGALIVLAGELVYQFTRLVKSAGGFGNAMTLLGDVAGAVWQGIVDSAAAIPPALDGVWGLMKAGFFDALAGMADGFYRFVGKMAQAAGDAGFDALGDRLRGVAVEAGMAANDLSVASDAAAASANSAVSSAADTISSAFGPAREALSALNTAVVDSSEGMDDAAASADNLSGAFAGNGGKDSKGGKKGGVKGAADKAVEALKRLRKEHEALSATLGMSEVQQKIYAATQELGEKATKAQKAEVAGLIPKIEELKTAHERLSETADSIKSGFQSAFEGIVTGAKSVKEAISDILGSFAQMLANRAFEALWGGVGGGGGIGGWFSKILPFATGTPYAPGGMALVGERGPELINLPRGSLVMNANRTRDAMAGGNGGVLRVIIEEGPMFASRVSTISKDVSVEVTRAGIQGNTRAQADNKYLSGGR